jgi:hypothetical protein
MEVLRVAVVVTLILLALGLTLSPRSAEPARRGAPDPVSFARVLGCDDVQNCRSSPAIR